MKPIKFTQVRRLPRPVSSLWIGNKISYFERVVLNSYVRNGHSFTLYTDDLTLDVPNGVELRDYREVCPNPPIYLKHADRKALAVFSDWFRLEIIFQKNALWVDMDAYCIRPFTDEASYVFGTNPNGKALSGVLALPPTSQTLSDMRGLLAQDNPIPPWWKKRRTDKFKANLARTSWTFYDLRWGVSGPSALNFFLRKNDEYVHKFEQSAFYPGPFWENHAAHFIPLRAPVTFDKSSYSLHLFGHTKKLLKLKGGKPLPGSIISALCKREQVCPEMWPL